MTPLLCSAYLPPINFIVALNGKSKASLERFDNYQKQTYRNRCVIAGANGPLALSVPVEKGSTPRQQMKDVRISSHSDWRRSHLTALESAYMNSPFFIYYQDDLRSVYDKNYKFLFDLNIDLFQKIIELIDIQVTLSPTESYQKNNNDVADFRYLIEPGKHSMDNINTTQYYQVFQQKNGFLPNLSVVDLLFNMGPESQLILNSLIL